jgi:DNA polymerase
MLLGEAPGYEENARGQPFIGPSGQLLARLMRDVGLPTFSEMFIANVCCCRAQGPPEDAQIMACMPNLRAQITLADPEWIVTLGNTALKSLQTVKAKVSDIQGKPFAIPAGVGKGRWCFPLYHPAAALRDNSGRRQRDISSGLSDFARVLRGEMDREVIAVRIGRGGKP